MCSLAAIDFSFPRHWVFRVYLKLLKIPQGFHPALIFGDLCPETPLISLKTLIGCVNEGGTFPSSVHSIKAQEASYLSFWKLFSGQCRLSEAIRQTHFRSSNRAKRVGVGYNFKLSELMTTAHCSAVCKLWWNE